MIVYRLGIGPLNNPARKNDFLNGDTHAIELIDTSPEPGLVIAAEQTRQFVLGRAVKPDNVPTLLQWNNPESCLADISKPSGFPCVSDRFKTLVESLEPGVHQFFPLKLVNKKGEHLASRWLWVVCSRIDSVDRGQTTLILWRGIFWRPAKDLADDEVPEGYDHSKPRKLVFNAAQTGGAHFWRDKHLMADGLYCSDAAARAIEADGMTGFRLEELETA